MDPTHDTPPDLADKDAQDTNTDPGAKDYNRRTPFTCGSCPATWTGMSMAHCANGSVAPLALTPWNGHPSLLAHRYTELYRCPVDGRGGMTELFADLWGTQTLAVKAGSLIPPEWAAMDRPVNLSRDGQQIALTIVGAIPVDVVNLIIGRHSAREDSVLVGFDVRAQPHLPAQENVAMAAKIPARLALRHRLAATQGTYLPPTVAEDTASVTPPPLLGSLNRGPAINTLKGGHVLHVTTLCHTTFGSVNSFDRHRIGGRCLTPSEIGLTWNETRSCWSEAYNAGKSQNLDRDSADGA